MKKLTSLLLMVMCFSMAVHSQTTLTKTQQGHTYQNKFRQMKDLLATPNSQRTASGAPGVHYTQQQVDYVMDIVLDDDNQKITGNETITYHNNSEDTLSYLWVQLDQNRRAKDSKTGDITPSKMNTKIDKKRYNIDKKITNTNF